MAEMGEGDYERPIRFSPSWPPRVTERPMPGNIPGCSMVFRKPNWPPPSNDDVADASASGESLSVSNGLILNSNPSQPTSDASSAVTGSDQKDASNTVKPKRAVRDYSSFFGKNAAPPTRPVYVLQPGTIAVPEAFSGNPEVNEQ